MPENLEIKASIQDLDTARARAIALPSQECGHLLQLDTYFGTLREGRLKLREINASSAELIFYTRPETSSRRRSTFERCPVSNPVPLKSLLTQSLGVRGVVAKDRLLFLFRQKTRIHLDRVDHLGVFIEFEVPLGDETLARQEIELLTAHFDLHAGQFITASYIDLLENSSLR